MAILLGALGGAALGGLGGLFFGGLPGAVLGGLAGGAVGGLAAGVLGSPYGYYPHYSQGFAAPGFNCGQPYSYPMMGSMPMMGMGQPMTMSPSMSPSVYPSSSPSPMSYYVPQWSTPTAQWFRPTSTFGYW